MAVKGQYTKPGIWDEFLDIDVLPGVELDPGVRYFVAKLNQMGFRTLHSCEGHPDGFYVVFEAPYEAAFGIAGVGYFSVEIEFARAMHIKNMWSIRINMDDTAKLHIDHLRHAADAWEGAFGPIEF